jgi:hypothetical protein
MGILVKPNVNEKNVNSDKFKKSRKSYSGYMKFEIVLERMKSSI